MVEESNPLVSICVITYNSSKYVIETLESAKAQTYQNIELIVSDDCSSDNTVELCREWIEKNKYRFVKTELITVEKNTGIPANCNRGLKASKGKWIKFIAGDDILLFNCIENNICFVNENANANFIASKARIYEKEFKEKNLKESCNYSDKFFVADYKVQLDKMVRSNFISAPSLFLNNQLLTKLGGFDERYLYEDYPLYIKILESGNIFVFMNKETVGYRIQHNSFTKNTEKLFNLKFINAMFEIQKNMCFNYLTKNEIRYLCSVNYFCNLINSLGLNNKRIFNRLLYKMVLKLLPIIVLKRQYI